MELPGGGVEFKNAGIPFSGEVKMLTVADIGGGGQKRLKMC